MSLIQNMIGILLEICIFFKYSAKRHGLLEENITQICVESSKKKLVKVKRDGLPDMMLCEYLSNCIKLYLKNVRHNEDKTWNSESITKANGLYNSMINLS